MVLFARNPPAMCTMDTRMTDQSRAKCNKDWNMFTFNLVLVITKKSFTSINPCWLLESITCLPSKYLRRISSEIWAADRFSVGFNSIRKGKSSSSLVLRSASSVSLVRITVDHKLVYRKLIFFYCGSLYQQLERHLPGPLSPVPMEHACSCRSSISPPDLR